MDRFIIEHWTRGCLYDFVSGDEFHFSWSGPRGGERCDVFFSLNEAKRVYNELPEKIRLRCHIRRESAADVDSRRPVWGIVWPL
jgi:hypothetical protein